MISNRRYDVEEDRLTQMGFVSVGGGGILLSHRHAPRSGDDILIWSLLVNKKVTKNVVQLWRSQLGTKIKTGFLLSSTPRIKGYQGLSWAPCSPALQSPSNSELTGERFYLPYDGGETASGVMTLEGLRGKWLVHKFSTSVEDESTNQLINDASIIAKIAEIAARYLENYSCGALLRPCPSTGPRTVPAQYRGNARGPLIAVCGSNDRRCWEWSGVFEWDTDAALSEFKIEDMLLG